MKKAYNTPSTDNTEPMENYVTPAVVYECAQAGMHTRAICLHLGVKVYEFKQLAERHPGIVEALDKGHKEFLEGFRLEIAKDTVEALKRALAKDDIKAIELSIKNVLGFEKDTNNVTNNTTQIGVLPAVGFDFAKFAPEEQARKLAEVRRARTALLESDKDVYEAEHANGGVDEGV